MDRRAIDKWIIVISGFLQTEGRPTGMVSLWRKLRVYANETTCVELRSWCQNWSDLAELIWRTRADDSVDVRIVGYSWGGYSAAVLARELKRRGLRVREMVLSDAVYRHGYILGQWRALFPSAQIEIPDNVNRVKWFVQQNPRFEFGRSGGLIQPAGHGLKFAGKTVQDGPHLIQREHAYMDDAIEFHSAAMEAAAV